ncbi:MAG: MBL fold metallo-hydrolase [Bacillota bacterium]
MAIGIYSSYYADSGDKPVKVVHDLAKERWAEVAEGVIISRGLVSENMTLVISGNEAAVIDTGFVSFFNEEDNKGIYILTDYIKDHNLTVRYVFFTHNDSDHFLGYKYFNNRHIENGQEPEVFAPNNTKDGQIINMGHRVFKIIATPGHSTYRGGHISVELVNENILASGDVLYSNFLPGMLDCDTSQDLLNSLNKIKREKYDVIIPGHGNIIDPVRLVDRNIRYLENAIKLTKKIINNGGTLADVYKDVRIEDCTKDMDQIKLGDARTMHKNNIRVIYDELTGRTKTPEHMKKGNN